VQVLVVRQGTCPQQARERVHEVERGVAAHELHPLNLIDVCFHQSEV
jgi:hypothetical protein